MLQETWTNFYKEVLFAFQIIRFSPFFVKQEIWKLGGEEEGLEIVLDKM